MEALLALLLIPVGICGYFVAKATEKSKPKPPPSAREDAEEIFHSEELRSILRESKAVKSPHKKLIKENKENKENKFGA